MDTILWDNEYKRTIDKYFYHSTASWHLSNNHFGPDPLSTGLIMTFLSPWRLCIVRYPSLVRLNCSAFPGKTEKRFWSVLFQNNKSWKTFGEVSGRFTMECRGLLTTLGFVSKIPFASHLYTFTSHLSYLLSFSGSRKKVFVKDSM